MEVNPRCKIGKVKPKLTVIENTKVSPAVGELRQAIEAASEYPVQSLAIVMNVGDSAYLSYAVEPEGDFVSLLGALDLMKSKITFEQYISR